MALEYPDPLPFRLRVLRALTDALKEITPDNGYVNDLSDFDPGDEVMMERVYRGRAWFGETDPIPMVSILEGLDPFTDVAPPPVDTPSGERDWDLNIQVFVDDDPQHPTDPAHLLLADVARRLAAERKRKLPNDRTESDILGLGPGKNKIVDLKLRPGPARPADDISAKAWGFLGITLRIVENAAEPYA